MARAKFYLDKGNAKLWGVCSGIADYTGIDTTWIRVAAVLLTVFVSFFTIPLYIAIAFVADTKPLYLYGDTQEERLLDRMRRTRESRAHGSSLRANMSDIDRRVSDIEAHYSSSSSRLAAEIDSLR